MLHGGAKDATVNLTGSTPSKPCRATTTNPATAAPDPSTGSGAGGVGGVAGGSGGEGAPDYFFNSCVANGKIRNVCHIEL
jgi:hypothetical protein